MAACAAAVLAGAVSARGADEPAAKPAPADTAVVERGPFEVVLEVKGSFEPADAAVVAAKPESWSQPLEILSVVPHGTRVNSGDPLVQFDPEPLDRAIADLKLDLALGEKSLELARRDLPVAEALHPLELADAERQNRVAAEDLARFLSIGKPLSEEAVRFGLRSAEEGLKYAREELRQLEQMYKDKDLTEETEEMILQRTRFDVVGAEFRLKQMAVESEKDLTFDIPRREQDLKQGAARAALQLEKAKSSLPLQLEQKRLTLAKQEHDRVHSLRRLEELTKDRGQTTLAAPRGGIVYYGRLQDGSWSTGQVAAKAIAGQAAQLEELQFTVVEPDRVKFRAKIEEKDLHLVGAGMTGRAEAAGYPGVEVPVVMEPFVAVPKDGKYDAVFAATPEAAGPKIVPGMTATARCLVYSKPDAVTVPAGGVFREPDGTRVAYVVDKDGKVEKRSVKPGRTSGERIEILEGLAAGDRVRTKKP